MFKVGDYIVYGKGKICIVDEIGPQDLPGTRTDRLYYTLSPVYSSETIFVPVDAPVFMRPVITREEAVHLIQQIPAIQESAALPGQDMDRRKLPEYYDHLIESHNCQDLVQLIITLYAKNRTALETGKRVCQTDQNYMKEAQAMLHGELAVALQIPIENVAGYIGEVIQQMKNA